MPRSHKRNSDPAYLDALPDSLYGMRCGNCGADIPLEHLDMERGVGACFACKAFTPMEQAPHQSTSPTDVLTKGGIALHSPKGVDIIETPQELDIRYSHFATASKVLVASLTLFTVIWNGTIILMLHQSWGQGHGTALAVVSVHLILGLVMATITARLYLNYTDVIVSNGTIEISTGPIHLPFSGSTRLPTAAIKQLYVQRKLSGHTNGTPQYTYDLHAVTYDRRRLLLLTNTNKALTLYLERSIEQHLGLEDTPVHSEATP